MAALGRKRPRFCLDCDVSSPEEKQALISRVGNLRKRLSINNIGLLYAMLDAVEEKLATVSSVPTTTTAPEATTIRIQTHHIRKTNCKFA